MNNPEFIIFTGPMFSSKTTRMLSTLERYKYQKKRIAVFKPKLDDRYSRDEVVSHSGWSVEATTITEGADLLEALSEMENAPDVIAVDETFMINGIAEVLTWLYRSGFTVVVSTLDISATGKPFSEVEKMMPWATHIKKCSAICTVCGRDAYYTHKKQVDDESEIQVGGAELYEPRCFRHHAVIDLRTDLAKGEVNA